MEFSELSLESQAIIKEIRMTPWPEIFNTGTLPEVYAIMNERKMQGVGLLLAKDGLMAWAKCHAGCDIPPNFGHGMVVIYNEIGCSLAEDLSKYLKNIRK